MGGSWRSRAKIIDGTEQMERLRVLAVSCSLYGTEVTKSNQTPILSSHSLQVYVIPLIS